MTHNNIKKTACQLLIFSIGIYLIVVLSLDLFHLLGKKERVVKIEEEIKKLKAQKEVLEGKLKYVESEEFVEKEAREKLNLAKEGEVVVVLPEGLELISQRLEIEKDEDLANWQRWLNLFF